MSREFIMPRGRLSFTNLLDPAPRLFESKDGKFSITGTITVKHAVSSFFLRSLTMSRKTHERVIRHYMKTLERHALHLETGAPDVAPRSLLRAKLAVLSLSFGATLRDLNRIFKERDVKQNIYYAHAMGLYGSQHEEIQRQNIAAGFGRCECPNAPEHKGGWEDLGMGYFDVLLKDIDGVAFEPYEDGKVGAGVAYEVNAALAAGKPVWRIAVGVDMGANAYDRITKPIDGEWVVGRDETRERNRALAEKHGVLGQRLWSSWGT